MLSEYTNNNMFIFVCLCLAVFRIYLEVIAYDFAKLPITSKMNKDHQKQVHKNGFYLSVGYLLLFGPTYFLGY